MHITISRCAISTSKALAQETKWIQRREELIPISKVGEYCEGEDCNTTLPIQFAGQTSMAFLGSGPNVVVETKKM